MSPGADNGHQEKHQLERRKNVFTQSTATRPLIVGPAPFKQSLVKYLHRHAQFGRRFSLGSVIILEYPEVMSKHGQEAVNQLKSMIESSCFINLRSADRLCWLSEGNLLILMPETDYGKAYKVLTRLTKIIASNTIKYQHQPLRASCTFILVESKQTNFSPNELMASIGVALDDQGNMCPSDQLATRTQAGTPLLFSGHFEQWLARYNNLTAIEHNIIYDYFQITTWSARDSWLDYKAVEIKKIEPLRTKNIMPVSTIKAIAQRAKALQAIHHQSLIGINDFHIKEALALYVVQSMLPATRLNQHIFTVNIDNALVFKLAEQLSNTLIFLQMLTPPLIPPHLQLNSLALNETGHVILMDCDLFYLLTAWLQDVGQIDPTYSLASQKYLASHNQHVLRQLGKIIAELLSYVTNPDKKLLALLDQLQQKEIPKELNTMYKVRSALREISGGQGFDNMVKHKDRHAQSR